ncbi:serine/threonine-protein kinase MPS1 isoform X1 [Punica granatum]|uniref:Serine/threonine-protein kinase MPS1 isoform X1 n=2 Tax=Punica granatum TaxID=22663 RepID=A0A6P8DGL9_PUNGR|nr:serine/threonine-protein kinase MPS1 isoform X1 [Punica granatum]
MDGEAKLPVRAAAVAVRPIGETTSSSTSSTLSSSSSPPGLIRHVQAAFKRHRPLGTMQSNDVRPRRMMVPSRRPTVGSSADSMESQEVIPLKEARAVKESIMPGLQSKGMVSHVKGTQDDPSITAPSLSATITKSFDGGCNTFDMQIDQPKSSAGDKDKDVMPLSIVESQIDRLKKVQFSVGQTVISQGAADGMATELWELSSHVSSLALTESEWNHSHIEASTVVNRESKQQNLPNMEVDVTSRSDIGIPSSLTKRAALAQDQLQQFRTFLNQPAMTQSSGIGTSCVTTTSVHSTSAPMLNSTTYTCRSQRDEVPQLAVEPVGDLKSNPQSVTQGHQQQSREPSLKETGAVVGGQVGTADEGSMPCIDAPMEDEKFNSSKEEAGKMDKELDIKKEPPSNINQSIQGKNSGADDGSILPQSASCRESSLDAKMEPSKSGKQEKAGSSRGAAGSRKRNYDSDCFFKVNGKLYQRLGKIGSGGSSEVHKVISSDCTIYALKKIKLKGRDYATAYGFSQEIEYLNRLKGKDNIIQLIDYEVTDKTLLQEVMTGSMNNKDGRVKDDGYIYMVLEHGEIDLARMLSQKWKELDHSDKTMDENWLRFYWQQILQAVNTIHEERIVHSDLKPANFLLVRGSLKLIDFGIAKAISSDTTNIQRDSQVGTLSYMSPEAFMCNESDANGNVIKCGRPSDIWSLGCILYQMVYGRTPFSEYKTFWSKFKVITDPNHEIIYEPVSNPWLLDLMKKCLAWDRNQRWRIPQLLEHPFLVPPVPSHISPSREQGCEMVRIITEACQEDRQASVLCSQLRQLLEEPLSVLKSQSLITSREQQFMLLSHVSKLCLQIRQHLVKSEQS